MWGMPSRAHPRTSPRAMILAPREMQSERRALPAHARLQRRAGGYVGARRALQGLGYSTKNLLLPGHGTSMRDFAEHGWDDWFGHVREETRRALDRGEHVVLIGHSMGAAVGWPLPPPSRGVAGVAALCSPLRLSTNVLHVVRAIKRFVPYIPAGQRMSAIVAGRDSVTSATPTPGRRPRRSRACSAALPDLHAALPHVACPTLVVCARNDHVVPLRDGLETFQTDRLRAERAAGAGALLPCRHERRRATPRLRARSAFLRSCLRHVTARRGVDELAIRRQNRLSA